MPEKCVAESGQESQLIFVACKVAARIMSCLHRAVNVKVFSDLSRFGVRLSYLQEFIKSYGGRPLLENMTTSEVTERFVTEKSKLSLCEQLISDGNGDTFVATAKVFLSHAWKYPFLDVVDAIERHFLGSMDADPVVWFDVFSVSQHKSGERSLSLSLSPSLSLSLSLSLALPLPLHLPLALALALASMHGGTAHFVTRSAAWVRWSWWCSLGRPQFPSQERGAFLRSTQQRLHTAALVLQ